MLAEERTSQVFSRTRQQWWECLAAPVAEEENVGSFDCVGTRFASAHFAQDDRAEQMLFAVESIKDELSS